MQTKISSLPILLGIIILILVFGYLGYSFGYQTGVKIGLDIAREKIRASGLLPEGPAEIKSLSGSITNIEGNAVTIRTNPLTLNPLEKQEPEVRKVLITDKTKIIKRINKPTEELMKEEEAFLKALEKAEGNLSAPPQSFIEQEIKVTDLKINDYLIVTAEENIKFSPEFAAVSISVR